jgi:catabolite regulation protein CreA
MPMSIFQRCFCLAIALCSVGGFGLRLGNLQSSARKAIAATISSTLLLTGSVANANEVREVGNIATSGLIFKDTLKINAFEDPKVEGVTIYLADFERPLTEKLSKDFFDDPSSTSLTCVQSGPIKIGDIATGKGGEEVFEEARNLFFKVHPSSNEPVLPNTELIYPSSDFRRFA